MLHDTTYSQAHDRHVIDYKFTSFGCCGVQSVIRWAAHFPKCTAINWNIPYWLVVSTPLKNISQLGLLFPIYGKIKFMFQTTNQPMSGQTDKNCIVSFTQWYSREHYGWLYAPMFLDTPCHYHIDRNYCGCSLPWKIPMFAAWKTFDGCFNPRIPTPNEKLKSWFTGNIPIIIPSKHIYLSIHQSIYVSIYLSIYLSICLSVYLSTCLSVYLSICLSILPNLSNLSNLIYSIRFQSILFDSILFCSILFGSILFYSTMLYSILCHSSLFYSILFYLFYLI